jgi:hypothetical protein
MGLLERGGPNLETSAFQPILSDRCDEGRSLPRAATLSWRHGDARKPGFASHEGRLWSKAGRKLRRRERAFHRHTDAAARRDRRHRGLRGPASRTVVRSDSACGRLHDLFATSRSPQTLVGYPSATSRGHFAKQPVWLHMRGCFRRVLTPQRLCCRSDRRHCPRSRARAALRTKATFLASSRGESG